MRQWPRIHWFQRSGAIPSADETQNTVSVVVAHSPVFGSRLHTVRSSRSTVLISFSHGVRRSHALAGNTVNSRVSQRLRPFALLVARPLGLRPMAPSSSLRRKVGWLSLTWASWWLPEAITRSNVFLSVLGVEREHATLQSERLDQFRGRRYLIALLPDHQMAEDDLVDVAQRRKHVRRLLVGEGVEAAAQRLAVDGDGDQSSVRRRRLHRVRVRPKRRLQRVRIDALENIPQTRVGRCVAQRQAERFVQTLTMNPNEFMHLPIRIGPSDHAQDRVQQHASQIKALAFGATTIRDRAQNLQQRRRHPTTSDSGCR